MKPIKMIGLFDASGRFDNAKIVVAQGKGIRTAAWLRLPIGNARSLNQAIEELFEGFVPGED